MTETLLKVQGIKKHYDVTKGVVFKQRLGVLKAVDGVSFSINNSKTFGLIGESGCGKTTVAKLILRMETLTEGSILFRNRDIWKIEKPELRKHRCAVQAVFQDPYGSLNPRMRVGDIISEPLRANNTGTRNVQWERVGELMDLVGLDPRSITNYPHEFSGGQRQRIALARAIASDPSLVVLDEPVSALDVSIRSQMMNLLVEIQQKLGLTYLLIAHDLAVVYSMSDDIGVMYLGKLVETAPSERLYSDMLHPYTTALFSAAMPSHPDESQQEFKLKGEVPSPIDPPTGCRFHPRCPYEMPECRVVDPPLIEIEPYHNVACHLHPKPISQ